MADYSNLFRGGGVSSPDRRKGQKGGKILFAFAVLVICVILIVWGIFSYWGDDEKKNPEDENIANVVNPGNKPDLPDIKEVNLTTKKPIEKSSLSPKKLAEAEKNFQKAMAFFAKDDFVKARDAAKRVIASGLKKNEKLWQRAAEIIGKSNIGIYMTDVPSPEKELYTIKEGDNLITIAKRFGTTVEAIQKSNGLNPANPIIFPGKTLYIYTGDWNIRVSKQQFRLFLFDGEELFKVYRVGIGRQGRTPSGTFKITTKQKEPVWYNEGKTIPYGDKENVLGTRWMAIKPIDKTDTNLRGYGIHGTWQPETIGTESSNGCIRMKNEDVNELFSILPYYTKVTIED
jgi:lipoprotein-anchoring transpeptidase ErfK/SrfK